MTVLQSGEHVFIGDIITFFVGDGRRIGRIAKFVEVAT